MAHRRIHRVAILQTRHHLRTSAMDSVPHLFVKSVLCNVDGNALIQISKSLRSRRWALTAASVQRKDWRFSAIEENNALFGIFSSGSGEETKFLSCEEFSATKAISNQVTEIDFDTAERVFSAWNCGPKNKKWTKMSNRNEMATVLRLVLQRLNFPYLSWLSLSVNDSFGMHSTFLDTILGKNARIEFLALSHFSERSTRLLEQLLGQQCLVELSLFGSWEPRKTVDLLKKAMNQEELACVSCSTVDTLHFGRDYFNRKMGEWCRQGRESMSISLENACLWSENEKVEEGRYDYTFDGLNRVEIDVKESSFDVDLV